MWTDFSKINVADLAAEDFLNLIKGNLDFLVDPPLAYYSHPVAGGNFSTTVDTYMVPIDPINLAIPITTSGRPLLAMSSFNYTNSADNVPAFAVSVDGNQSYRHGVLANYLNLFNIANGMTVVMFFPLENVPAGDHIITWMWAKGPGTSGSVTIVDDYAAHFAVWELAR